MDNSIHHDFDSQRHSIFSNPALVHKDLETLSGILEGIISDKIININEHHGLVHWLNEAKPYEARQPYKEIISVIRDAASDDRFSEEELKNINWLCKQYIKRNAYYSDLAAGIINLTGIVKGIAIDGQISENELDYLHTWLIQNDHLKTAWPYDELFALTMKILEDGELSASEHDDLLLFCNVLTDNSTEVKSENLSILSAGFFQVDPEIIFDGRNFCITGISIKKKRSEIAEDIQNKGGVVASSVSKKLDYLIVCNEKNSCWAYSCYGRKIEEVMNLRKSGVNISVIHEIDLFDALNT